MQARHGDLAWLNRGQIAPVRPDNDRRIMAPDSIGFLQIGFAVVGAVIYPTPVDVEPVGVRPLDELHVSNKMASTIGNHWVGRLRPFVKVSAHGNLLR